MSLALGLLLAFCVRAVISIVVPSSFPHDYPGIPNLQANFSDSAAWQEYFLVKDPLPNITFPLSRSFAGNIPVNRQNHPNDTLYFYAFEKSNGSLTTTPKSCGDPWLIWLNGGPGSSSLAGLFLENGPIHIGPDLGASPNEFSWDKAVDTFWIDQPVGTGWATADAQGYAADEDQVGADFFGFLSNLVQIFPSLSCRPLHLVGESYAGQYIPYITKTYFGLPKPPVTLKKIAIGDGTMAAFEVYRLTSVVTTLETYPQLIGFDPIVLKYFQEQSHLCNLDINLTYPQKGVIPTIQLPTGFRVQPEATLQAAPWAKKLFMKKHKNPASSPQPDTSVRDQKRSEWKRDLIGRPNGTIDLQYGCDVWQEMIDYALNFTFPWSKNDADGFNVRGLSMYPDSMTLTYAHPKTFRIPDALDPETPLDASVFLNDPRVRSAIHAPTSKDWSIFFNPTYPFNNSFIAGKSKAMNFLSDLATNSSARGVAWVIYSGNDDSQDAHKGTEITIQNTTFGGVRGFTRVPSTPWKDEQGTFMGIVHQERIITYVLFDRAGHQVPLYQPPAAFHFLQDFVLGNSSLGRVETDGHGHTTVIGGESSSLATFIPGEHNPIFYGSGATQSSTIWPSATIAAWDHFIATATHTSKSKGHHHHPRAFEAARP